MCSPEVSKSYMYEVAAIERPTHTAALSGAVAKQILDVTTVIANGRSSAIAAATLLLAKAGTAFDPQRTDWIVRKVVGDNA